MNRMVSRDVGRVLKEGDDHFWVFDFVGYGEAPVNPVRMGGYIVRTVTKDPPKAHERLEALRAAHLLFTDIIVAEEAPRFLGSPAAKPVFKNTPIVPKTEQVVNAAADVAGVLFGIIAFAIQIMFLPLMLIDPAVFVRLPGGEIILITNYME